MFEYTYYKICKLPIKIKEILKKFYEMGYYTSRIETENIETEKSIIEFIIIFGKYKIARLKKAFEQSGLELDWSNSSHGPIPLFSKKEKLICNLKIPEDLEKLLKELSKLETPKISYSLEGKIFYKVSTYSDGEIKKKWIESNEVPPKQLQEKYEEVESFLKSINCFCCRSNQGMKLNKSEFKISCKLNDISIMKNVKLFTFDSKKTIRIDKLKLYDRCYYCSSKIEENSEWLEKINDSEKLTKMLVQFHKSNFLILKLNFLMYFVKHYINLKKTYKDITPKMILDSILIINDAVVLGLKIDKKIEGYIAASIYIIRKKMGLENSMDRISQIVKISTHITRKRKKEILQFLEKKTVNLDYRPKVLFPEDKQSL